MTDKTPKSAGSNGGAGKSKNPRVDPKEKRKVISPRAKEAAARRKAHTPKPAEGTAPGDRIAKVLARAGIASRRDAEAMIEEGRVSVNGRKILSPALNVLPHDRIKVDGQEVGEPEPPRLWLYHKPTGLVTTARDEKGRETVFENLPDNLPRVMSVGRLDLNSEGLLLLTNDGDLKRQLELPDTGWLRKYRVRVKGTATEQMLEPLRKGITLEGETFQPMDVTFDRQQGANAWLTVGLREGKNREIRRAMEHIGLIVNRLMRISYGPFRLGTLKPGEVEEVRPRVLRDQLGLDVFEDGRDAGKPRRQVSHGGKPAGPRGETTGRDPRGGKPDFKRGGDRPRSAGFKSRDDRDEGRPDFKKRDGDFKSRGPRRDGDSRDFKSRDRDGDGGGFKRGGKPDFKKRDGDRPYRKRDEDGGKPAYKKRDGDFKSRGPRRDGEDGGKPRSAGFKSHGGGRDGKPKSAGFKSHGGGKDGKPRSSGFKSHGGGGGNGGGKSGGRPAGRGGPRKPRDT